MIGENTFEEIEDRRLAAALNDAAFRKPMPQSLAEKVMAIGSNRHPVHRQIPRWAQLAASLVLMAGFVFAATVVVDAVTAKDDGSEAIEGTQEIEGTNGSDALAESAAISDVPYVSSVASIPFAENQPSTANQLSTSNNQPENEKGEKAMTIKQKAVAALAAAATIMAATAAPEYTIHAPNGIGDVTTLTNVLATMETDGASQGLKLWLEPGVYNLRGVKMENGCHLSVRHTRNAVIAGLGAKPEDTILLGGGEDDKCRVAYVTGGGNYWTTTISNLTVTGGYADKSSDSYAGRGGGICAGNTSVLYDTCIISNNVAVVDATTNGTKDYGGGGCYLGRARNCLFADNRTTGAGGGISTAHRNGANQTYTAASIVDCVFTNNQSSGSCYTIVWDGMEYCGGGGAVCVPSGAIVSRTKFIENSSVTRGGAICINGGECAISDCEFIKNVCTGDGGLTSKNYGAGGALYGWSAVTNCTFIGNESNKDGGAIFVTTAPRTGAIVGCHFYDNKAVGWAHGGAIRTREGEPHAQVFSSDFSGNTANNGSAYGHAAYDADLFDCVVSNHVCGLRVLYNCNLTRCRIRDNQTSTFNASFDDSSSIGAYTNVNCEFAFNRSSSAARVSYQKVNVNCTYWGNELSNGNYSHITLSSPSYNCIFTENKIGSSYVDVRAHDLNGDCTLVMTNCLFNKGDSYVQIGDRGYATNEGLANCRQVANMKFDANVSNDRVPTTRSTAYNAGYVADWLLAAVGNTDLLGQTRVFGDGLDIGAIECQRVPPGMVISVK